MCILFDLDGTLIDSAPDLCAATNRVLAERGRAPISQAQARRFIGRGARRLLDRALRASGGVLPGPELDQLLLRFLDVYQGQLLEHTRLYPGVADTLDALAARGWAMAIATNKPSAHTQVVVEGLGLRRWFEVVVAGDDVLHKKPAPDMLQLAQRRLGRSARWMVGDSDADMGAARAAGLRAVAVGWGYAGGRPLDADHLIATLPELLPLVGGPG